MTLASFGNIIHSLAQKKLFFLEGFYLKKSLITIITFLWPSEYYESKRPTEFVLRNFWFFFFPNALLFFLFFDGFWEIYRYVNNTKQVLINKSFMLTWNEKLIFSLEKFFGRFSFLKLEVWWKFSYAWLEEF